MAVAEPDGVESLRGEAAVGEGGQVEGNSRVDSIGNLGEGGGVEKRTMVRSGVEMSAVGDSCV